MNYSIIYKETLLHSFNVDADSKEDAIKKFENQRENGKLDFSYGELEDSGIILIKLNETDVSAAYNYLSVDIRAELSRLIENNILEDDDSFQNILYIINTSRINKADKEKYLKLLNNSKNLQEGMFEILTSLEESNYGR